MNDPLRSKIRIAAAAVVVPVHDEEALLGASLTAVDRAAAAAELDRVTVVVVLDRCIDASATIAGTHAATAVVPTVVLPGEFGAVGAARAAGVDVALRALATPAPAVWIATTDADSCVPDTWLTDQVSLAAQGADAIAGVVSVEDWSEHPAHVPGHYRRRYNHQVLHATTDHHHPHVHGANLGVRADAYLAVGGFPPLATSEDVALWHALGRSGHRLVSTRAISVVTSARRRGRAPDGFAAHLRSLA